MSNRRNFLKSSATAVTTAATLTTFPSLLSGQRTSRSRNILQDPAYDFLNDPAIKALAKRAVDAAQQNGATFSDARITKTNKLEVDGGQFNVMEREELSVGVRALVNGVWGFAAAPVVTGDEVTRLGISAVAQAKANGNGPKRSMSWVPAPSVANKHWSMPVKMDPFELHVVEIMDFLQSLGIYIKRFVDFGPGYLTADFLRQDKVYASSDGSLWSQRVYSSKGEVTLTAVLNDRRWSGAVDLLSPAGEGWELFRDQPLHDAIDREMERMIADSKLMVKPVDVGKYDVILDASSVTSLLRSTIGAATELDRAMGYEANAGGTSYINDPMEMLGTFAVGSPLLSVAGNRSAPASVATVAWDDESVVPDDIPLITKGVVTDYSTARESAGWLAEASGRKKDVPLRSHGCAYAPSGIDAPLVCTPNLVMTPGETQDTLESLVSGLKKGYLFTGLGAIMDFQLLSGLGLGNCYEIKDGVRVALIENAGVLFNTPELWKNLTAIGGPPSMRRFGGMGSKGEPSQESSQSVTAVPVAVKEVSVIDVLRKA